jgi:large subunit ribosomal protein L24
MRTAKALQKIKHIKHMKNAIRHHEATRAKKDPIFKERFNAKQARLQEEQYHAKFTRGDVKKAKRNYKEDWALGPLRPNRAVGENAELYGAMEKDQLRWPDVPIPTQRMRNKLREKAGLDPEWPIVIDDMKVYPFAKGDRVVVIRGKEMNKIGVIENINEEAHVVELKDVNKVCGTLQARLFHIVSKVTLQYLVYGAFCQIQATNLCRMFFQSWQRGTTQSKSHGLRIHRPT